MNNQMPMPSQVQGVYQPMDGDIKTLCHQYMSYQVIGQMSDGSQMEGIITGADEGGVTMLVPEDVDAGQETRQYGYDDGYNDYDDYGRPRRRRYRRYRQRRFPYGFFRRLFRYPYYYPYYPYYPGYGYDSGYGYGSGY